MPELSLYSTAQTLHRISSIVGDTAWANDCPAAYISSFSLHACGIHAREGPAKLRIGHQGSAPSAHRNLETNSLATLDGAIAFLPTVYNSCQIIILTRAIQLPFLGRSFRLQRVGSDPVPPQPFCQPQPPACGQSNYTQLPKPAVIEAEGTQKTSCGIPAVTGPASEPPVDTVFT